MTLGPYERMMVHMRNIPKPLNPEDWMRVRGYVETLAGAFRDDVPVTLNYRKRDRTMSSSTGKVHEFVGKAGFDTFSVNVVTLDKGIRTINLCRIESIRTVD